jgi:p-aminobenzoyl-glutamate transporter AbgT
MKKIKTLSKKNIVLLLVGLVLFSQVSQTDWPYLAKEYVVLIAIQLYFVTSLFIIPRLKDDRSKVGGLASKKTEHRFHEL